MKLIIASNNADKIREIKEILSPYFEAFLSLKEAGIDHETVEDGNSFIENAVKKAREVAQISGRFTIADDSGICVDALDGAPGIYSARFCGRHGDDKANNMLLLEKMKGVENRSAHYTCAIALASPDGNVVCAEEYMYGEIGYEETGTGGFGYDPLFFLPEFNCTSAQITQEQKNEISHRGKALRALVDKLENR